MSLLAGIGRLQNTMILLALLAASRASGFSSLEASVIAGSLFAAAALSALWKGQAVDVLGRGVVRIQALALAALFVLLILAFLWAPWWAAALASAAVGLMRINPAALQQALWAEVHKNKNLLFRALSWENTVSSLAQTIGPLLAALAIWLAGDYAALILLSLLAPLSMIFWSLLAPKRELGARSRDTFILTFLPLASALFFLALGNGLLQGLLLRQDEGALLLSIYTLGAGATGIFFFRRPFPEHLLGLAILAGSLPLASLFVHGVWMLPALFLAGMIFASGALAANIRISQMAPTERKNEAFSLPLLMFPLGMSGGILLSGLLLGESPEHLALVIFVIFLSLLASTWRKLL